MFHKFLKVFNHSLKPFLNTYIRPVIAQITKVIGESIIDIAPHTTPIRPESAVNQVIIAGKAIPTSPRTPASQATAVVTITIFLASSGFSRAQATIFCTIGFIVLFSVFITGSNAIPILSVVSCIDFLSSRCCLA